MVVDKVYSTPLLLIHWPMDKVVSVRLVWKQQCHDGLDSFHDIDNYSQTSNIIACRRCSNYIFIPDLTSGFNVLCKNNCKTRPENSCFGIWSHYIRDLTANGRRRSQSWFIMALMRDIYCNTWCYRQNYGMDIFFEWKTGLYLACMQYLRATWWIFYCRTTGYYWHFDNTIIESVSLLWHVFIYRLKIIKAMNNIYIQ